MEYPTDGLILALCGVFLEIVSSDCLHISSKWVRAMEETGAYFMQAIAA